MILAIPVDREHFNLAGLSVVKEGEVFALEVRDGTPFSSRAITVICTIRAVVCRVRPGPESCGKARHWSNSKTALARAKGSVRGIGNRCQAETPSALFKV
jgi:hypothetical protein